LHFEAFQTSLIKPTRHFFFVISKEDKASQALSQTDYLSDGVSLFQILSNKQQHMMNGPTGVHKQNKTRTNKASLVAGTKPKKSKDFCYASKTLVSNPLIVESSATSVTRMSDLNSTCIFKVTLVENTNWEVAVCKLVANKKTNNFIFFKPGSENWKIAFGADTVPTNSHTIAYNFVRATKRALDKRVKILQEQIKTLTLAATQYENRQEAARETFRVELEKMAKRIQQLENEKKEQMERGDLYKARVNKYFTQVQQLEGKLETAKVSESKGKELDSEIKRRHALEKSILEQRAIEQCAALRAELNKVKTERDNYKNDLEILREENTALEGRVINFYISRSV
jgi:hypothetical protein